MVWREVWQKGIAPLLSDRQLAVLLEGLRSNDPALLQGQTTSPIFLLPLRSEECNGVCLLAYPGWKADGLKTVEDVYESFNSIQFEMERRVGIENARRFFLWFDTSKREAVFPLLVEEVSREIQRRKDVAA